MPDLPLGGFSRLVHADADPGDCTRAVVNQWVERAVKPVADTAAEGTATFCGPSCVPPVVDGATPIPGDARRVQILLLVDAALKGVVGYARFKHKMNGLVSLCVLARGVIELYPSLCLTTGHGTETFPPEQAELAVRRFLELE